MKINWGEEEDHVRDDDDKVAKWVTIIIVSTVLILLAAWADPTTARNRRVVGDGVQPDIVVVMTDDLGAIDNRVMNKLPAIKALWLDNGLRFDHYYNETPLCCPGRAGFLTGQHTRRHGVKKNQASLLDPSQTVATALNDVGYQTAQIGKYLNNLGSIDKTPPGWDYNAMASTLTATTSTFYVQGALQNFGYIDRATSDMSLDWVENAGPEPLFLWANPKAPHWGPSQSTPWTAHTETRYQGPGGSRCNYIPKWNPPDYAYAPQPTGWPLGSICRSLLTVDDMVAGLRSLMAARGRPTVWIFTSDNGMAWGRDGFPIKNVPKAGRTPLWIATTGTEEGAGVPHGATDALLSNIDLGPTLAELGGASMPWADGASFLPVLDGTGAGREYMIEDHPLGGYTQGPWRSSWWGVRTPLWHLYYRTSSAKFYLYDLTSDPWEQTNVATSNPQIMADLIELFPYAVARR